MQLLLEINKKVLHEMIFLYIASMSLNTMYILLQIWGQKIGGNRNFQAVFIDIVTWNNHANEESLSPKHILGPPNMLDSSELDLHSVYVKYIEFLVFPNVKHFPAILDSITDKSH